MTLREMLLAPARNFRSKPSSAILTVFGIVVGVSLAIILVGFAREFATGVYRGEFNSLAASFSITKANPHGTKATGIQSLSDSDVQALQRDLDPSLVAHVIPIAQGSAILRNREDQFRGGLVGATPDYLAYMRTPLIAGTMFSEQQFQDNARVVLVGPAVVKAIFEGSNASALGAHIMIGRLEFQVIGLLGTDATGGDAAVSVAPLNTVRNSMLGGIRTVGAIGLVATSVATVPSATREATAILEREHTPRKMGLQDDFTSTTFQSAQPAVARKLLLVLFWFALGVAVVALIVGSVGLSNLMLKAVDEGTHEIGIRRVVGASSPDILKKFLAESVMIGAICGLFGVGVGAVVAVAGQSVLASVAPQLGAPHLVSGASIATAFGLSLLIGLLAGLYPAVRATRLRIPDAVRRSSQLPF
jgi:putative ABC transport system permease protein